MAVIPGTACLLSPITIVALRVFVRFPTSIGASRLLGTPALPYFFSILAIADVTAIIARFASVQKTQTPGHCSYLEKKKEKRKDFRRIGAETRSGRRPVKLQIIWKVMRPIFVRIPETAVDSHEPMFGH